MSHIVEFSVAGLAGRQAPYSQKLDRNVNVFFGENGSGKTSLLKILHSAIKGDVDILTRVPFTSASVDVYSVTYDKIFHRTINADQTAQSQAAVVGSDVNVDWRTALTEPLSYQLLTSNLSRAQVKYWLKEQQGWSIDPAPGPDFRGGFIDRYLPTSRV
jgi:predicted ATP-dependent endonuclease of OLD family